MMQISAQVPAEMTLMARTDIIGQYTVELYRKDTGFFEVHYGAERGIFANLKNALNNYNQCCLHAETAAGWHDADEE